MKALAPGLALLLAGPAAAAVPASQSPLAQSLRSESARSETAAAAPAPADAKAGAGTGFDAGRGLPVTVEVLQPVEYAPIPGGTGALQPAPDPGRPAAGPAGTPGASYHFEGRRAAIPNLTIYTPVKDAEGQDGSTRTPPKGGGWKKYLMPGMAVLGAAATIGGFFFPPLFFLGGLLLGAWGATKLLSAAS